MATKKREGSWWRALLWLLIGAGLGLVIGWLFWARPVQAGEDRQPICHVTPGRDVTIRPDSDGYRGHFNKEGKLHGKDYFGECEEETELRWKLVGEKYTECTGDCESHKGTRVHTKKWECVEVDGEGPTLKEETYDGECNREGQTRTKRQVERCEVEEPPACEIPTVLVCFDNGEDEPFEKEVPDTKEVWKRILYSWPESYKGECEDEEPPGEEPPTPPVVTRSEPGPAGAPPVCTGKDLGDWAPTITRVWREDSDTVGAEWTASTENADDYIVWYGLTEDNLEWNKYVENSQTTTVDLPDHPNVHVWFAVQATDNCVVGPLSTAIDP